MRREALVFAHLEGVSRDLLVEHRDIVRQFIGRNAGIYALYRKNRLYYVGLASALRHSPLRARQESSWKPVGSFFNLSDNQRSAPARNWSALDAIALAVGQALDLHVKSIAARVFGW